MAERDGEFRRIRPTPAETMQMGAGADLAS